MNSTTAGFFPYPPPQQWPNLPSIPNQYNGPCPITGKVVRVRPNIYIFVCNFCFTEYRTIDSFLRHSESHFQLNEMNSSTLSPMAAQFNSNQNAIGNCSQDMVNNINAIPNPNSIAPYPVQMSQNPSPIDVTLPAADDLIEEVYEIIDLGYDHDGQYPDAHHVAVHSKKQPEKKGRSTRINGPLKCWFCNRSFARRSTLKRHENIAHQKFLRNIISQKKAYKCKLCSDKFPKVSHTLKDAHEHLKCHL